MSSSAAIYTMAHPSNTIPILPSHRDCCKPLRAEFKTQPPVDWRFCPVSIVLNNNNRPEPDRIACQLAVGFEDAPKSTGPHSTITARISSLSFVQVSTRHFIVTSLSKGISNTLNYQENIGTDRTQTRTSTLLPAPYVRAKSIELI